jgi:hypothetical protein
MQKFITKKPVLGDSQVFKKPITFGFQMSLKGPPNFLIYFKIMSKDSWARFQNFETKTFTQVSKC